MKSIKIIRDIKNGAEISIFCNELKEAHKIVDWYRKEINEKDETLQKYLEEFSDGFKCEEDCILLKSDEWGICEIGCYDDVNYKDIEFQCSLKDYSIGELLDEIKYRLGDDDEV